MISHAIIRNIRPLIDGCGSFVDIGHPTFSLDQLALRRRADACWHFRLFKIDGLLGSSLLEPWRRDVLLSILVDDAVVLLEGKVHLVHLHVGLFGFRLFSPLQLFIAYQLVQAIVNLIVRYHCCSLHFLLFFRRFWVLDNWQNIFLEVFGKLVNIPNAHFPG